MKTLILAYVVALGMSAHAQNTEWDMETLLDQPKTSNASSSLPFTCIQKYIPADTGIHWVVDSAGRTLIIQRYRENEALGDAAQYLVDSVMTAGDNYMVEATKLTDDEVPGAESVLIEVNSGPRDDRMFFYVQEGDKTLEVGKALLECYLK